MKRQTPKLPILIAVAALFVLTYALSQVWERPLQRPMTNRVTVRMPPLMQTAPLPETAAEEPKYEAEMPAIETPEPPKKVAQAPAPVPAAPPAVIPGSGRIALIIDDVGISHKQTEPVFKLPHKVTMSFLPYGHATPELARKASEAGYEVLLHMPMQPIGHQNPGPDAIRVGLGNDVVTERLDAALAMVPQAVGVNNHMGSEATSDPALMQEFMTALKPTGKFFIDSFTGPHSVAYSTARSMGIPALKRNVFLDNDPALAAIHTQLHRAEEIAKTHGYAVVIGHPYDSTLQALQDWLPQAEGRGLEIVKLGDLLAKRQDISAITPVQPAAVSPPHAAPAPAQ